MSHFQPITMEESMRFFAPQKSQAYRLRWLSDGEEQVISGQQLETILHSWKKRFIPGCPLQMEFIILGIANEEDFARYRSTASAAENPRDVAVCAGLLGVAL